MTPDEALHSVVGFVQAISPSEEASVWEAIDALTKLVDAATSDELRALLRHADNGVHYCRTCPAGSGNGWRHEVSCPIAIHDRAVDAMRERLGF